MDIGTLAKNVVAFLAPLLPYLIKGAKLAGQEAVKKLGERVSEESVAGAKSLWEKLRPKVEAMPAAQEAAQKVAENPDNAGAQTALRRQVRKILAENKDLAAEVSQAMASKVIQRVLAEGKTSIQDVEQRAKAALRSKKSRLRVMAPASRMCARFGSEPTWVTASPAR